MLSSVAILLAACGLYGLIHSLLASHAAKRFAEAREAFEARYAGERSEDRGQKSEV